MKKLLLALSLVISGLVVGVMPLEVEAKRLGGGKPAGMQRQAPARPAEATPTTPPQQAAPAPALGAAPAAAGTAAAAAGKRSWLGPVAGIAAGLGIAALASHFGFGEGLAQFVTMMLIAGVAFFVIRWLMRRFIRPAPARGGLQFAGAPGKAWSQEPTFGGGSASQPSAARAATLAPTQPAATPEGFDRREFERIAKMIFVRLQAANDAGRLDDLRKFTTPELYASLAVDLQERAGSLQQTDVLQLEAQVQDTAREGDQWIVSVRFSGMIRERSEAGAEPFAELWHLVAPVDGSRDWAIAGITPLAA